MCRDRYRDRYRLLYRYSTLRLVRENIFTGTGHFGEFGTSIPTPETSVHLVRHQYRYRKLRQVRYDINTGAVPVHAFLTVPDTWVSSVHLQYRYRTLRKVRYDVNAGTGRFGKFGTTSIPVSRIPVPYRTHPCENMTDLFRTENSVGHTLPYIRIQPGRKIVRDS